LFVQRNFAGDAAGALLVIDDAENLVGTIVQKNGEFAFPEVGGGAGRDGISGMGKGWAWWGIKGARRGTPGTKGRATP